MFGGKEAEDVCVYLSLSLSLSLFVCVCVCVCVWRGVVDVCLGVGGRQTEDVCMWGEADWRCVLLMLRLMIINLHAVFYVSCIRSFANYLEAVSWNFMDCKLNGHLQSWRNLLIGTSIWLDEMFHEFYLFILIFRTC